MAYEQVFNPYTGVVDQVQIGNATNTDPYLMAVATPGLINSRTATGSSNISLTDNGAGNTFVFDLTNTTVIPGSYTYSSITVDAKGRITAASNGAGFAPTNASFLTLGLNAGLTDERVATASSNISITDAGPNSTATFDLTNTTVTPGSYTYSSITVDAKGRVTAASSGATGGFAPANATYLVLSLDAILTDERVATASSNVTITDAGAGSTATFDLSNTTVTPGTYGNATNVSQITVDQKGRITSASNIAILFPSSSLSWTTINGTSGSMTAASSADTYTFVSTNGMTIVALNGAPDTLTVDTPQDIRTSASPTFVNATLSARTSGRVSFFTTSGAFSDDSAFLYNAITDELSLSTSGSSAGLLLGGDVKFYRRATDIGAFASGDSLEVPTNFAVGTTILTNTAINVAKTQSANASGFGMQMIYTVSTAQTLGTTNYIMNVSGLINAPIQPSPSSFFVGGNYEVYLQSGSGNNRLIYGGNFRVRAAAGLTGGTTTEFGGGVFSAWNDAATGVTISTFFGGKFDAIASSASAAGTISDGRAGWYRFGSTSATATTVWTALSGLYLEGYNGGAGAIPTWIGINAPAPNAIGAGATTNADWANFGSLFAFSANNQRRATINISLPPDPGAFTGCVAAGIYFNSSATAERNGLNWNNDTILYRSAANILSTGTGDSFRSDTSVLTPLLASHATGSDLTVRGFDLALSTGTNVLVRGGNGSGAKGGVGGSVAIRGGTGATPGSVSIYKVDGTTRVIQVDETGLGFFAVAPIARPTVAFAAAAFVANTSGIVNDSATYGGYTGGQIAGALIAMGILT